MTAQYWTITGYDIWRLDERKVFDFKNLNTDEVMTCDVIDAKFKAVIMPKIKRRTPKAKSRPRAKSRGQKVKKEKAKKAKSSYKKSKYKGVKIEGKKFSGHYWDKVNKKPMYLGMFDSELLAAAAVQEALGNKKEAKRLRNEYQESTVGRRPEVSEPQVVHKRIFPGDKPNPARNPSEQ